MTLLILATAVFCALCAAAHLASIVITIARVRSSTGTGSLPDVSEGVSIVRPVCGIENFAAETLGSALVLDYPRYEVLFCVARSTDPVVPLVRRLIAEHPDVPARLLFGNDRISPNPKLNNIVKGWAAARYDWIVMADSNVLMPRDYVQRLLAAWRPDTGLVCSPAVGYAPDGLWAELECGFLNTYQARWQQAADALGFGFAQGKTMLWRREILEAGGGIRALAAEVAEDAAATKLVRRLGRRVQLVATPFTQPLGARSFADVWRRQVRWARLRRDTFMIFFVPEVVAGPVAPFAACMACAAAAEWPLASVAGAFATAWYGVEAMLAYVAGWQLSYRSVLAWIIRDLLLPVLWITSWMGNDFVWRGNARRRPELVGVIVTQPQWKSVTSPARQIVGLSMLEPATDAPKQVRTLFLSDVHLGMKGCQADKLLDFLREYDAETIYLVGDIVDGWQLKASWYWPQTHNDVVQKLLRKARKGARVLYIPGNHDEFLRDYYGTHFGGIEVVEHAVHITADSKRYLVIHGDLFDVVIRHARWLALLGDKAYDFAIWLNTHLNRLRRSFGLTYWSLAQWAKLKVKNAVNFIGEFECTLAAEAHRRGLDGVICGHIHYAVIRRQADFVYVNCGDWIESCTAVIEDFNGVLEIVRWTARGPWLDDVAPVGVRGWSEVAVVGPLGGISQWKTN